VKEATLTDSPNSVDEGESITYTVEAGDNVDSETTLSIAVNGSEAGGVADKASGDDFSLNQNNVTVQPGGSAQFTIDALSDFQAENTEGIQVSLIGPNNETVAQETSLIQNVPREEGRTFSLTSGSDSFQPNAADSGNQTTSGDDTFRGGSDGDLSSSDLIDAGGGTDTLLNAVLTPQNGGVSVAPSLTSVENIRLDAEDSSGGEVDTATFNANSTTGAEEIRVDNLGDLDSGSANVDTFTVDNVAKSTEVGFRGATNSSDSGEGSDATVNFNDVDGDSDSATVALYNSSLGDGSSGGSGLEVDGVEDLTVRSGNDSNSIERLSADAATSLTVTGSEALTISDALSNAATSIETIDASNQDGGVTVTTGGLGQALTFNGSGGDDTISADALGENLEANTGGGADTVGLSDANDTVNTGAGNDRVNLNGSLSADDSIDGGDGSGDVVGDTAGNLDTVQSNSDALASLSNFEGVAVSTALGSQDIDLSNFGSTGNRVILEGQSNNGTLSGLQSGATVRRTNDAADSSTTTGTGNDEVVLTIPGATDANTPDDTINFEFASDLSVNTSQGSDAATTIDAGLYGVSGINNLNITATDTADTATDGSEGYDLSLNSANAVDSIDASGSTAGVTVDGTADSVGGNEGVVFTGGSGRDFLTGTDDNDIINGGDNTAEINDFRDNEQLVGGQGDDQINAGGGWTFAAGGAGADEIDLGSGEADGASVSDNNNNFDGLIVGGTVDFHTQDTDAAWYQSSSGLIDSNNTTDGTFDTAAADKVSNFNLDQDTVAITGGVGGNTGEAAVLDVGGAEDTNDFMNGAISNDGSGNAVDATTGGQGIVQVALGRGDEDESTLSSADDLLDETAVLNELETANGEGSTDGTVSLGTEISDLDDMAFTVFGPDGSFGIYSFQDGNGAGSTDSQIVAEELSLVALGSDGNVNDTFDALG